jgi:hypothetical protein
VELAFPLAGKLWGVTAASLVARPRALEVVARDQADAVVARARVPQLGAAFGIGLRYAFFRQAKGD